MCPSSPKARFLGTSLLLATTLALSGLATAQVAQVTKRVSMNSNGGQANGASVAMSMSADARYVAFASSASNLVIGDFNSKGDIFVHDRQTGTTKLVSVSSAGVQGNKSSGFPVISGNGRFIAFNSGATNLVPGDVNGVTDVFVHDAQTGVTEIVSKNTAGVQGNGTSLFASLSDDGRYAAYRSAADNLVVGDTNSAHDVFVHDRLTGSTHRVSRHSNGVEANASSWLAAISGDGSLVAFSSSASNLDVNDTNSASDIFVNNLATGHTELVSLGTSGVVGTGGSSWPSISADGRFVAFQSGADDLIPGDLNAAPDVFVRDRQTGTTELISKDSYGTFGNGDCNNSKISGDGRHVAFTSSADNLAPGDTNLVEDLYVHDRKSGLTERISIDSYGGQAVLGGGFPSISADGRHVAYNSESADLVTGDTNNLRDVFIHDRMTGGPELTLTNVVAGQVADFSITGATPGGYVVVGVSLTGQGPTGSPWGPLELDNPSSVLIFNMDAAGQLNIPIEVFPGLIGLPLWVQGIDVTMNYPTSAWGGLIQ